MRLFPSSGRIASVASSSFRPDLESLDGRIVPAVLLPPTPTSCCLPTPVVCATPTVAVNVGVSVNLNAVVGLGSCTPTPCTPTVPCAVGQVGEVIGGLVNQVGTQVATDVHALGCYVGGVVHQIGTDVTTTVGVVNGVLDALTTGCSVPAPC